MIFTGCPSKAYANDWTAAITTKVFAEENESHLINKADLIKTETFTLVGWKEDNDDIDIDELESIVKKNDRDE